MICKEEQRIHKLWSLHFVGVTEENKNKILNKIISESKAKFWYKCFWVFFVCGCETSLGLQYNP